MPGITRKQDQNNKQNRQNTNKKPNKQQSRHTAQQPEVKPEEKSSMQQPEMMDTFLSVLAKIATALTVAPVQGAQHVGNRHNPIDDDIDMDLIDLDN